MIDPIYSGGEVRLGTGQLAQLNPGGTVQVLPQEPYHLLTVAHGSSPDTQALAARGPSYQVLIDFLRQLEGLGYLLLELRRVTPG